MSHCRRMNYWDCILEMMRCVCAVLIKNMENNLFDSRIDLCRFFQVMLFYWALIIYIRMSYACSCRLVLLLWWIGFWIGIISMYSNQWVCIEKIGISLMKWVVSRKIIINLKFMEIKWSNIWRKKYEYYSKLLKIGFHPYAIIA